MVPDDIQKRVWRAYRAAGGTSGPIAKVTDEWLAAVKAAEDAVRARLAREKTRG